MPITWLLDQMRGEWTVIKSIPLTFFFVYTITFLLMWYFLKRHYSERIKTSNETLEIYRKRLEASKQNALPQRSLSQIQKNILIAEFKVIGKDPWVRVYAYPGVNDAAILRDQFHLLFNEAGWSINIDSGIIPESKYSVGIWLIGDRDSKHLKNLEAALTKSGLKFHTDYDPQESDPFLVIGEGEQD
jgi:hypothetical protein